MKIKWREYDAMFVLAIVFSIITSETLRAFTISAVDLQELTVPFTQRNLHFNYFVNVLFPKLAFVLVATLGYFWLSASIVPNLVRMFRSDASETSRVALVVGRLMVIVVSLVVAVHVATSFAHPHFWNYGGWHLLAIFGYLEVPYENFSQATTRGSAVVVCVTLYLLTRESIIYWAENSVNRLYKTVLVNQISLVIILYFLLMAVFRVLALEFDALALTVYATFVPASILVFFFNIYWLFPRNGARAYFYYSTILKTFLITSVSTIPFFVFGPHLDGYDDRTGLLITCVILQITVVTPLSRFYYIQRKDKIKALLETEIELKQSTADLQFLRSQINPHFLFNALNTLYGTAMRENAPDTVEGIQRLGDMMRFMLHENHQDFIPLEKEIAYLENYVSLQKLRLTDRTEVVMAIDEFNCQQSKIAPMLLIPFVENAFKHGVSLAVSSWVKIELQCREGRLDFMVRNSLIEKGMHDPEEGSSGVGLGNVRQRLLLFYPGRHILAVGVNGNEYIANLSITLI
jgi:sensor histidine kinase YesM